MASSEYQGRPGRRRWTNVHDIAAPTNPRRNHDSDEVVAERAARLSVGWVYAIGPIMLIAVALLRRHGLVANMPLWAYAAVILGSGATSKITQRWGDLPAGSARFHIRIALHAVFVTGSIYMSGWGPAVGVAYIFSAQADIDESGAAAWRASLRYSIISLAAGQIAIALGWAPSFLAPALAQTIGCLGAFLCAVAIRLAGQTREFGEITEERLEQQAVEARRSEARHRAVVENASEGILTFSLDGTIETFNAAAESMYGWPANEIVGRSANLLVPEEFRGHFKVFLDTMSGGREGDGERNQVEIDGVRRDGSRFPMTFASRAIVIEGLPTSVSALVHDLSEQKRYEAQLTHLGLHDALTGLANRAMLTDRIDQANARARRHATMIGVLFVDLDRFKTVNDLLGHAAGDAVLVEVTARLRNIVREVDTIARLGGDEFVVLCEDIEGVRHVTDLSQRIVETLSEPFSIDGNDVDLSASVGIAISTDGLDSCDTLLTNADTAMYRAKQNGRARYQIFDDEMQVWIANRLELEVALRHAVRGNELRVYYQPIVGADPGEVAGFEALVRWERPGVGLVNPDEFIGVAEETGLIVQLGAWVLEESCREAASWVTRFPGRRLGISVNVSSREILAGDIAARVVNVLDRTGLDPTLLTLELTESTLIDDAVEAKEVLHQLRNLGVNLALDDFGTGYSSLTYLRTFPFNSIKIDRSFVKTIGTERDDTAIVAAVVALARNLHLRVVAEGIETPDQLASLLYLNCEYLQGYLFSPPVPHDRVAAILTLPTLVAH